MSSSRSRAPASWLHLGARTARLRLTLLYAGTFLVLGTAMIAVTNLLASRTTTIRARAVPSQLRASPAPANRRPGEPVLPVIRTQVVAQHSADLQQLLTVSWFVLAVTAVASAVLGWVAAGRVLSPLRDMAATARTISAGNHSRRLALVGPNDEFKQLADTLDELLARLEASFEAQRRFVANASHELRTPLTLERTLLQVALADPDASAASLRATCEELLATGREHEQLLEALLTLATSERGTDRREPLDLAVLAGQAVQAGPRLNPYSVRLISTLEPAPTMGDPALIERLITNLIDNAVRYNRPGGRVEIRTAIDGSDALLSIANTGPVVSPEELERLFEPFQRLGKGRAVQADGYGLGLSIVRAIANAHGAAVNATADPEGGLVLTVSFPAANTYPPWTPTG